MKSHHPFSDHPKMYFLFGLVFLVLLIFQSACEEPREIEINKKFPIEEGTELSPPIVYKPIHECAEEVYVYGFLPHAKVMVYANTTDLIGQAQPDFGFADIPLTRPLNLGEKITATQTINGVTSFHSIQPVIVSNYPAIAGGFNKPTVSENIYECGVIVPVGDLIPSVLVEVYEDGSLIGSSHSADEWKPVWTSPLNAGKKVTAKQIACKDEPAKTIESPLSDPVTVKAAPNPTPAPIVDGQSLFVGNDAVTCSNLYTGAKVTVYDNGNAVGGGYANGSSNWVPINPAMTSNSIITVTQELCGPPSPHSDPEKPTPDIYPPKLASPICEGSQFVIIRKTIINAYVVVRRNNSTIAYGGGNGGELILALGGNVSLNQGDVITAYQYIGQNVSGVSNSVTVSGSLSQPVAEIKSGEHFFNAENGEQSIGAPVFPRGKGSGPSINIMACCKEGVEVTVHDSKGNLVKKLTSTEIFPGYYKAQWDWSSDANWSIPDEIPVGRYSFAVRSKCGQKDLEEPFYIIFNPADVNGPARFSFNETGIWFYSPPSNTVKALVYHLHPDDKRIFDISMNAATGLTDPKKAAEKISDAEEALFSYSLSYHSNDVLDLLANHSSSQCADDAGMLTGLLRAVGIPAHPVTADAALETGQANWTFDTWTEFLVPTNNGNEWLILHPHEYPADAPATRSFFGANKGVATKSFNDLMIMADENWVYSEASDGANDVSYNRNSCGEPEQTITKKNWVFELCENAYWPNHWACGSVTGSDSSPLTSAGDEALEMIDLELDSGNAGYGRTLGSTMNFRNKKTSAKSASLQVQIVGDIPESKKFPDFVYTTLDKQLDIPPNGQIGEDLDLDLPNSIPAGVQLYQSVKINEKIMNLSPINLSGQITAEVDYSNLDGLKPGDQIKVTSTVRNSSKKVVTNVEAFLNIPFALTVEKEVRHQFERLMPNEEKVLSWNLEVIAPIEVGTIDFRVNSADGGAVRQMASFTIEEDLLTVPEGVIFKKE